MDLPSKTQSQVKVSKRKMRKKMSLMMITAKRVTKKKLRRMMK